MPVEVVSYMLSSKNLIKRLQFQIIMQCAPFLKGLKIACIINLNSHECECLDELLEHTDIAYRLLARNKKKCLVFLYREKELQEYLRRLEVADFLEAYGYVLDNLAEVLELLSDRVCQYSDGEICFPHEIGAFLDYPIDDVKCFIEKGGKDCLLVGYWKVYNNPGKAQMIFSAYDKAKTSAVNEFMTGKTIRDIAYKAA